jgi:Uncharacterized protein containing SIS (Sugar ISomerase) phosphosugar binding domain
MNAAEKYFSGLTQLIEKVHLTQANAIEAAAQSCAATLADGGMIYTFGTGHSHLLAEEIFYRAGGLARVCPINESGLSLSEAAARSSAMERLPGLAKILLDDTLRKPGDTIFIFSNSGRNTVAVDMALEAHAAGLTVICVTNLNHSASAPSRHPSGKKLFEVCDIVIDNCGCIGDAAIQIGADQTGATSTAVGAAIMQAITCRTVELCAERNEPAEVYRSANTEGGDKYNAGLIEKYKTIIRSL